MTCKLCGGETKVTYSKKGRREPVPGSAIDLVRRRRKCLRCGEPFSTRERREDDAEGLTKALETALKGKDKAERRLKQILRHAIEAVQDAGIQWRPVPGQQRPAGAGAIRAPVSPGGERDRLRVVAATAQASQARPTVPDLTLRDAQGPGRGGRVDSGPRDPGGPFLHLH